jgi:hypothetical protein
MPGIVRQVLRDAVACTCPARVCLVPGGSAGDSARAPREDPPPPLAELDDGSAGLVRDSASFGVFCQCHLIPPQAHAPGTNVPPCTGPPARTARHPQWLVTGASWEDAVISDEPNGTPGMYSNQEAGAQIAFVLICAHFFSNGAWLEEDQLLRN